MFGLLNRSGTSSTVAAVQGALAASNLPAGVDPGRFSVVESRGAYAGRKVTYFRVFDPRQAASWVRTTGKRWRYQDLEPHPALVLWSGYVEDDGTVMLKRRVVDDAGTRRASDGDASGPQRVPADPAAHPDDARFVGVHATLRRSSAT